MPDKGDVEIRGEIDGLSVDIVIVAPPWRTIMLVWQTFMGLGLAENETFSIILIRTMYIIHIFSAFVNIFLDFSCNLQYNLTIAL
jgi:hypothetical protein